MTRSHWRRMGLAALWYCVLVFVPAGTTRWIEGWIFLVIVLGFACAAVVALRRSGSGLLEERAGSWIREGQPAWDRAWLVVLVILTPAWIGLAGLDAVRWRSASIPWWLETAGGLALITALLLIGRVMQENPFASHVVRVQEERGQRVIDTGPYAIVRHPMYSAMLLLFPGGSLLLGSYLSLGVAVLICMLAIVRVPLEEAYLRRGLPGYDDYCRRVRRRLIPGVW